MNATRDQVVKEMMARQELTKAMAESDLVSENYGRWRFAFDRGRLYYTQAAEGSKRWTRARYTVKDHTFTVTVTDYGGESPHGSAEKTGESFSFHWSRYRDRLTLTPVDGQDLAGELHRPAVAQGRLKLTGRGARPRAGSPPPAGSRR